MSKPIVELPTQGGSYIRSAAGALERAEGPEAATAAVDAPAPAVVTAKPSRKEA